MIYIAYLDEFGHVGPYVARSDPRHNDSSLIEPPFHLESHRYQTVQAADWIAALVGRLGALWKEPDAWPENAVFRRYFEGRLAAVQVRSGIRG